MSVHRIKGQDGVVLDSNAFLELPKAQTEDTSFAEREGMIRYNDELNAFEGVSQFRDNSEKYQRFPQMDSRGALLMSHFPDSDYKDFVYMGSYFPFNNEVSYTLKPTTTPQGLYPLPVAAPNNKGHYYSVTSIHGKASSLINSNLGATSPFISTNLTFGQYKIYFIDNPLLPGNFIVTKAFFRLFSTDYSPVLSGYNTLNDDLELTAVFDNVNDYTKETALTDGDYIVSDGSKWIRIRNTMVSISATQVQYEPSISNFTVGTGAGLWNKCRNEGSNTGSYSSGSLQTILDDLILNTVRRNGDSMYSMNGGNGGGELALVYGTESNPALCFTNSSHDMINNPGNSPDLWSARNTGLYYNGTKSAIGVSVSNTTKMEVSTDGLTLFHGGATNENTNPTLKFYSYLGGSQGMSGTNNRLSFTINGVVRFKIEEQVCTFINGVTVNGDFITNGNNYMDKSLRIKNGSTISFVANSSASSGTVSLSSTSGTGLDINLNSNNYDVRVMEPGSVRRAVIGRYGIKLPVLNPINDAVGEDGMIAYSPERESTVQKINGTWSNIGAGSIMTTNFSTSDWVLNGSYYTYTVTKSDVMDVRVQELISGNYVSVEVDTVSISPTTVTISIPSSSDYRFNGRIITISNA